MGEVRVDMAQIVARKKAIVQRFRSGIQSRVDQRPGLRFFRGHGRFVSPRQVQVGDDMLESEKIFIDTGSRPDIPRIQGLEATPYLTNGTLMEVEELPSHLLIVGGGYIGLEFGQMFLRFGSRVTIIYRGQLLGREDPEVVAELQKILESEGIEFRGNTQPVRVLGRNGEVALTIQAGTREETIRDSHLLLAAGRKPNTDDLGLEKTGVAVDSRGYIKVNGRLETSVPGIWAIGDAKGGPAFTHISYNDQQILYGNLIEGKNHTIDNRYVPYSLFTDPQLGRVGMTEKEARASGRRLKIGTYPMAYVARAIERDETAGFLKLIVDAETDRILGASLLGSEAGELVQILGALMLAGAPYTVLKGAVYIHPTLAEGFFGLMDAVKPVH